MALVTIPANDVDTAGLDLDVELPVAWLDSELSDADVHAEAPGRTHARLSRSGNQIVVRGNVKAQLATPCARCLEPARFDVTGDLSLLLEPVPGASAARGRAARAAPDKAKAPTKERSTARDKEYEFGATEAELDTYDGETVVLDSFLREALLLEVPTFPLCSDDCPGIRAGASGPEMAAPPVGIDPRLAPLGRLKAQLAGASAAEPEPVRPALAPRAKLSTSHKKRPPVKARRAKREKE